MFVVPLDPHISLCRDFCAMGCRRDGMKGIQVTLILLLILQTTHTTHITHTTATTPRDGMRGMPMPMPMPGRLCARASDTSDRDADDTTIVDETWTWLCGQLLRGIVPAHCGQALYHSLGSQNFGHHNVLEPGHTFNHRSQNHRCIRA